MVVGSQIPPEKTSYYLKYTREAHSKAPIFWKLLTLWATNLFVPICAPVDLDNINSSSKQTRDHQNMPIIAHIISAFISKLI